MTLFATEPPEPTEPEPVTGKFGTIIADPPWDYATTSRAEKLRGYSDGHYQPLTTDDLCALPVGDLATRDAVLLMWTTFPFIADAQRIIAAWGFDYVTGLAWVKADPVSKTIGYGVGYWFRGAVELILIGKRDRSYRSQYVGLIADGLKHSRKPESLHALAEHTYPGPRLEIFARRERPGWVTLGDECPNGRGDVRDSIPQLAKEVN